MQVLKQYFGHDEFKREQWNIIRALMYEKRDCCVIASTGFGKSLIYQYPAVFMDGIVVVISPLVALMQDQVFSLQSKGIKACYFGSQQMDKTLLMEDHKIVYITPEYYNRGRGRVSLKQIRHKILLFAIDEAHVLDQWGNDFRPDYQKLHELRDTYPNIPIIALTATAPKYLELTIIRSLKLQNFYYIKTALDRPNLEFVVRQKTNNFVYELYPLLKEVITGSAIVYCLSRELTEQIAAKFVRAGIKCKAYHAKLPPDVRKSVVNEFRNNTLRFVICTIAFGMGIDKPDVRLVVHYGVSKSIEAYYQEAGRAGRDGKPSKCVLFHSQDDYLLMNMFIDDKKKKISEEQRQQQRDLLYMVAKFIGSTKCRRIAMLNYLNTTKEELAKLTIRKNCCDNCKRDLLCSIPPELRYYGVNDDGTCDFSNEARILFKAVNGKLIRNEIVNLLLGVLPSKRNFHLYKLSSFRTGFHKSEDYWLALISLLIQSLFIGLHHNALILENEGLKFLRLKGISLLLPPTTAILSFMQEKENVEFYWDNEEIKSRPKTTSSQAMNLHNSAQNQEILNEDEIENEALIEAAESAEAEDLLRISKDLSEQSQNAIVNMLEEIEENEEILANCTALEQSFKEQQEIESLKNLSFDDDDDDIASTEPIFKRRSSSEDVNQLTKRQKK